MSNSVIWKKGIQKNKNLALSLFKFPSYSFEYFHGSLKQWNRDLQVGGGKDDSHQVSEIGLLPFLQMCCHLTD